MDRQRLFLTVVAAEGGQQKQEKIHKQKPAGQTVQQLLNESVKQQSWMQTIL